MNDFALLVLLFMLALAALATWAFFNTYWGVHDSLSNATPGSVYNFLYAQPLTGTFERYLAKVTSVRKMSPRELSKLNMRSNYRIYDDMFMRSPTLVTCKMSDGTFRQFYAERSSSCYRSIMGKLLFTYVF